MLQLFSKQMRRNPYPYYEQVRRGSPLLHDPQGVMWLVFDYDGVKRVLTQHEVFSSSMSAARGKAPEWFVFTDPPRHGQLRNVVSRAFTPRVIARLEPGIRELSRQFLNRVIGRGEMDLVKDYAGPLPGMVIAELIGIPAQDKAQFVLWNDAIQALSYVLLAPEPPMAAINEHAALQQEILAYLRELLDARRREPQEDILSRLVEAEVDGEALSESGIIAFIQLLFSAGTETSTNMIDNAMLCFIEHPDQLARLRADPGLLPMAIEEVLRYRSPVQMMFRETRQAVELHGQVIPAGKFVLAVIGSANHDPKFFEHPERFDIGRDPNPHIAFGHGVHFCVGAPLARLVARIAIPDLLSRLQNLEPILPDWEPQQPVHVYGPARLPVRFKPGKAVNS
ncbi:MAG: cytochrome P450 [Candidatus Sericytochromatia bacterium]